MRRNRGSAALTKSSPSTWKPAKPESPPSEKNSCVDTQIWRMLCEPTLRMKIVLAAPLPGSRNLARSTPPFGKGHPPSPAPGDVEAVIAPGRIFGDYQLLAEIGRGGMGVVFRARQISLDRTVALKMILSGELAKEAAVRRFRMEAETAARLEHPNIVSIHEVGECKGLHYFTMALVEGGSLAERLSRGPLPPREAAELVATLARAVEHAHRQGTVHRDIKPANILLQKDEGGRMKEESANLIQFGSSFILHPSSFCPKITDFGLAKRLDSSAGTTATGDILGTASYMAPEQAEGKVREVGPLSDVYSLGAVLYAALTGRPPFLGENNLETLLQVLEQEPVAPRLLNAEVPRNLQTICLKCLEKQPRNRYGSARELAEDLECFLRGEPIRARPPGPIGKLRRWSRKHPALATTWAALAGFYINHLVLLGLDAPGEGGFYHYSLTVLMSVWAVGAWGFEMLSRGPSGRSATLVAYGWTALDVSLFTIYLFLGEGPRSAVIAVYLVLIASAPLRGGLGLVWFTTALTMASYVGLEAFVLIHDDVRAVPVYQAVIFVLCMSVLGLIQHLLLRRLPADVSAAEPSS